MKKLMLVLVLLSSIIMTSCTSIQSSILGYEVLPLEQLNSEVALIKTTDEMYGWEKEEIREQLWLSQVNKSLWTRLSVKKINDKKNNSIDYLVQFSFESYSSPITTIKEVVYKIDDQIFTIEINNINNSISHGNQFVPRKIYINEIVNKEFVEALANGKEIKCRIYTLNGYMDFDTFYFDERQSHYSSISPYTKLFQDSLKIMLNN